MKSKLAHESEEYRCESCHEIFKRARKDPEAWDEYHKNLEEAKKHLTAPESEEDLDEVVIICDDCYQALKAKAPWLF